MSTAIKDVLTLDRIIITMLTASTTAEETAEARIVIEADRSFPERMRKADTDLLDESEGEFIDGQLDESTKKFFIIRDWTDKSKGAFFSHRDWMDKAYDRQIVLEASPELKTIKPERKMPKAEMEGLQQWRQQYSDWLADLEKLRYKHVLKEPREKVSPIVTYHSPIKYDYTPDGDYFVKLWDPEATQNHAGMLRHGPATKEVFDREPATILRHPSLHENQIASTLDGNLQRVHNRERIRLLQNKRKDGLTNEEKQKWKPLQYHSWKAEKDIGPDLLSEMKRTVEEILSAHGMPRPTKFGGAGLSDAVVYVGDTASLELASFRNRNNLGQRPYKLRKGKGNWDCIVPSAKYKREIKLRRRP